MESITSFFVQTVRYQLKKAYIFGNFSLFYIKK